MANYYDVYLLPIPKKHLKAYQKMASKAGKVWREHGALDYKECVSSDLKTFPGLVSFTKNMKLKKGEVLIYAHVGFKSERDRNKINAKVMKDERMNADMADMNLFDMKRMVVGGFEVIVDE